MPMRVSCVCAISMLLASVAHASPFLSYHIGNSLTMDLLNGNMPAMSASVGRIHLTGHHGRASAPLNYMVANPLDVNVGGPSAYGTYDVALPGNTWDAVTFQPYMGWGNSSTLQTDVESIQSFINLTHTNPANANTRFYIYAPWPSISLASSDPLQYTSQWHRPTTGSSSQLTILAERYFVDLYDALHGLGVNIDMIPVGQAIYDLDVKMRAGEIPGYSGAASLYRDDVHLNSLGWHIASCTAYATMFAESPVGLPYSGTDPIAPDALLAIQQSVWQTVTSSPYTNVPEPGTAGIVLTVLACGATLRNRRKAA